MHICGKIRIFATENKEIDNPRSNTNKLKKMKRFTLQTRAAAENDWLTLVTGCTMGEALMYLDLNERDDARYGEDWEYQIIPE